MKINKYSTIATLTILHNKEEEPMDELELSPNIKKFTNLHFNLIDNVQYNFLGFMEDGNLAINYYQSKMAITLNEKKEFNQWVSGHKHELDKGQDLTFRCPEDYVFTHNVYHTPGLVNNTRF